MARQAAQAKMGFYPIDPYCMESIAAHLALPKHGGSKAINIIDPCCGEGAALQQLATILGIPEDQVYGVELDGNRLEAAKARMPGANWPKGPASMFGMRITGHSFSCVYINPPFDFEFGGGQREEQSFAEEAYRLLTSGGVMVLVCPLSAINENRPFCQFLDSRFEDLRMFTLPDGISRTTGFEYRRFKEIVVIARKRRLLLTDDAIKQYGTLHMAQIEWMNKINWEFQLTRINKEPYKPFIAGRARPTEPRLIYTLPTAWRPMQFYKSEYLPEELAKALETSPLGKLTRDVEEAVIARPPVAPGRGHVAMLLAAGQLNGLVEPEGDGENHVVRGTVKKVEYFNEAASTSTVNPENGCLTTKDVFSQKPVCVIRAAFQDGAILTLSDDPPAPTLAQEAADDTNEGRGDRIVTVDQAGALPGKQSGPAKSRLDAKVEGKTIVFTMPDNATVDEKIESIVRSAADWRRIPPWEG